nr:LysR family transcriptional regulator [Micromonospora sp. DSM 115978]
YGLPAPDRGTAAQLAHRAAACVAQCKTRLVVVDDVHFLDVNRRDGREVANHFKWLANTFPVTFLFVGVGLRARGLLDEGLSGADAAFSQTARRWNVLSLTPVEIHTESGRRTWRNLLLGVERDLVLAETGQGAVAEGLSDYLFARYYLYELLTGGNLAVAAAPYRLVEGERRVAYHDFVLGMPAALAAALTDHARTLLASAGVTDEPLHWQPPAHWVTTRRWPGSDPEQTDPGPVHELLTRQHRSPQQAAEALHISIEHVRQVVRLHPLPRPLYPTHRAGAILPLRPDTDQHHQKPGIRYVDLTWLHEQYVTWKRTLLDIAREIGCPQGTLRRFAETHGIPLRSPRSGHLHHTPTGTHPSQLPEPLRSALVGHKAHLRLHRFTTLARHASLTRAAEEAGVTPSTLCGQLAHLERTCGGPLLHRAHPRRFDGLTDLGRELQRQVHAHLLDPEPTSP